MLTIDALNAAMPLATLLDNRDLILTPVVGSPLEVLVGASRSSKEFNSVSSNSGNNIYLPSITDIEYIANIKDPILNVSQHDVVMDDVVKVVSDAVRNHMVFAKSVVAPTVENLVTRTKNQLAALTPSSLLSMEVVIYNPPKPLLNSSLDDAVHKFIDLPFDIPVMNMRLPSITASEIIELMNSGSGGLDNDISEWAAVKGDLFFINIWENVFQIKQAELNESSPVTFKSFVYDSKDAVDNALAIYLLARKLESDPLPNTEMSIQTFEKTIINYRNHAAARLCLAFDEIARIDKAGILVRSMNKHTTVVNGSVYRKWIESGGENEVLFGNCLNPTIAVSVNDINSNSSDLKELWNRHATLISSVEHNRLFTRTKEILAHEFNMQLREVNDSELGGLENRTRITTAFNDCLTEMREDEFVDLWDACLKLLCCSRFVHTEARRILLGIERVHKENPYIDVRECAAISVIEYCSYWLSTQLNVHVKV